MKSPITRKEMALRSYFKNIGSVSFKYWFYYCNDSKEQFTTAKLDELNIESYSLAISNLRYGDI